MIETVSLALGIGFSALVYYLSLRPANISRSRKAAYALLSFIGIAGMLFLFGMMAAFVLNRMK